MPICPKCNRRFRVLDDEQDIHECPSCGYFKEIYVDPNQLLTDLRDCLQTLQAVLDHDGPLVEDEWQEVITKFTALDDWLCRGGFYPVDWNNYLIKTREML